MNILEGKDVQFTSGPWQGSTVHLAHRNTKGTWRILKYESVWHEDKINDQQLLEFSKDVRIFMRDVRLSNLFY